MVGAVIGNYQLVRKLGEGGYLGQHTLLGRGAAIKVLLPALSARTDIINRFFNEARTVTSISDLANAKTYFSRVSPKNQPAIREKCQQEGLNL